MLEKSSGSIVNITSIIGPLSRKNISAYTTSKGGIVGLTKALAVELGPQGFAVMRLLQDFLSLR